MLKNYIEKKNLKQGILKHYFRPCLRTQSFYFPFLETKNLIQIFWKCQK